MDSNQQLRTLWSSRYVIVAFALLAAIAAYLVSSSFQKRYDASALAQINPAQQSQGFGLSTDQLLQTTNFYSELARTTSVVNAAEREGKFSESLDGKVDVAPQPDLLVLKFTGSSDDPKTAAAYANAYAQAFTREVGDLQEVERRRTLAAPQRRAIEIRDRLEKIPPDSPEATALETELTALQARLADLAITPTDSVRVLQPAIVPTAAAFPNPARNAVLAFLIAFVLACGAVLLRHTFADRYLSAEEAAVDLGLPVMAELPRASATDSKALEAFRKLRAQVEFSLASDVADHHQASTANRRVRRAKDQRNVLLVTSPEPASGKTYVSSNLSRALAADGRGVVTVDGDLRRPTLHNAFAIAQEPGLGEVLTAGEVGDLPLSMRPVPLPEGVRRRGGSLEAITAGRTLIETPERLSSDVMATIVEQLHADYDFVVLDSPPVLAIVDAVVLSRYADGVVLVVDARRSRRRNVRRAVETLRAVEAPILGLVFNKSNVSTTEYGYYGAYPAAMRDEAEIGQ